MNDFQKDECYQLLQQITEQHEILASNTSAISDTLVSGIGHTQNVFTKARA